MNKYTNNDKYYAMLEAILIIGGSRRHKDTVDILREIMHEYEHKTDMELEDSYGRTITRDGDKFVLPRGFRVSA